MCEPHRNLSAGSPLLIENCKSMGFCTMESEGKMRYRKCRRDVQMPKQNIEAVNISAMTAEQRDAALALDVERLLRFGRKHKLIKELDAIVARNTLLDLLGLAQPSEENVPKEDFDTPAARAKAKSAASSASCMPRAAPKLPRTGSMICALCPTTSARRKLPRTSSGARPPLTVSWKLPST